MSTNQAVHGVQLPQPPDDGITALRFASHSALLLLSSWDGVRSGYAWLTAVLPCADVFLLYCQQRCFISLLSAGCAAC